MNGADASTATRRQWLVLMGASIAALVAGCVADDDDSGNSGNSGDENRETGKNHADDRDGGETDTENDGDESDDGDDQEPWEDVDEIRLAGHMTEGWTGIEPAPIEDETNPGLILYEGREYELTWENEDGAPHNVELRNDEGATLAGTDLMDERGETQTLSFEATISMVEYVCTPHSSEMIGEIEVRSQ